MAQARNPNRDKAYEIWSKHGGKITNREIAAALHEDERKIAVWKQRDNWAARLSANVVQQKACRTTDKPKRKRGGQPGNGNAKGHGAPKGNQNGLGNKGGAPKGSQNARKHGFYSKFIPIDEVEILQSAPGAGNLERDLKVARYKLARLLKYQQSQEMQGTSFGPFGVEVYKLQDDYYEPLIQKQLKLIADLELKIHKIKTDSGLGGADDDVVILDDLREVQDEDCEIE